MAGARFEKTAAFLFMLLASVIALALAAPIACAAEQDEVISSELNGDVGITASDTATAPELNGDIGMADERGRGALPSARDEESGLAEGVSNPNAADASVALDEDGDSPELNGDAGMAAGDAAASGLNGDVGTSVERGRGALPSARDGEPGPIEGASDPDEAAASVPPEALAAADDEASYEDTHVNMYRLYNPNSGEHFYTASLYEATSVATAGWQWEGIGWVAPTANDRPVFRLYNPNAGDHHYTLSAYERDHLISVGWSYEGVGWYSDAEDQLAVFRQYNPNAVAGAHNFTTSSAEDEHLGQVGWSREGTAWYATDGDNIAIQGFWLVTGAWGELRRYWIDSSGSVARGRFIDPSEGSGWEAYATPEGFVVTGKWDNGAGHVYVSDSNGELASTADGADGWLITDAYDGSMQRYYYEESARAMRTSFFEVGGARYYGVGGQGYVLRNEYLYGYGQWNYANNDGVLSQIGGNEIKNALISVINHANGAGYLTLMGGANYNLGSAAGARLASAVQQIWADGSGAGFVMMDLTTGHGVACSPHDVRYSASTIKGPYVAAINHYAPGSVDSYVASLMNDTIKYSSNDDYAELRNIYGGDIMQWQMDYSGVGSVDPHSRYVYYSAADLAKLWVGNYWYFYKDTNERSGWCRDLYTQGEVGADALIYNALGGSYTIHAKPGWFPGSGFDVQNDAGIVMAGERPYVLSILSSACMNYGALTELIWALDAVHSDMA